MSGEEALESYHVNNISKLLDHMALYVRNRFGSCDKIAFSADMAVKNGPNISHNGMTKVMRKVAEYIGSKISYCII